MKSESGSTVRKELSLIFPVHPQFEEHADVLGGDKLEQSREGTANLNLFGCHGFFWTDSDGLRRLCPNDEGFMC